MNIREFSSKELKGNKNGVESLINLYDNFGNCDMNGYLGVSVDTISFDKYGLLEFSSHKKINHLDVYSKAELWDSINEFGGSVILVTHEPDFYEGLVDLELKFE